MTTQPKIDFDALRAALDHARESRGWSWRQLAKELGVTPSTLSRLANGGGGVDLDTFARAVSWLGMSADAFLLSERSTADPDLVAQLAPLLRARKDLRPQDIAMLEDLIGAAARRFAAERAAD